MTNLDNLEGTRTPEELAENFRELNRIAPTAAEKFRLMFGHTNETMNDLPANLPPLPPVPEGFDRWEYRGMHWDSPDHCTHAVYYCDGEPWSVLSRCAHSGIYGVSHYIEAVRDEPAKDQPASGVNPPCDCIEKCGRYWAQRCYCYNGGSQAAAQAWCDNENAKDEPATGTEDMACEDALAPFRNVARGIPDNWPGECILRFDQRGDGTIFLAYHGVNDASGGITIDQWRALLPQPPEGGKP